MALSWVEVPLPQNQIPFFKKPTELPRISEQIQGLQVPVSQTEPSLFTGPLLHCEGPSREWVEQINSNTLLDFEGLMAVRATKWNLTVR